jgi:hypothetical protein
LTLLTLYDVWSRTTPMQLPNELLDFLEAKWDPETPIGPCLADWMEAEARRIEATELVKERVARMAANSRNGEEWNPKPETWEHIDKIAPHMLDPKMSVVKTAAATGLSKAIVGHIVADLGFAVWPSATPTPPDVKAWAIDQHAEGVPLVEIVAGVEERTGRRPDISTVCKWVARARGAESLGGRKGVTVRDQRIVQTRKKEVAA